MDSASEFVIENGVLTKYLGEKEDLVSVTIPEGVTEIGHDVFSNCSSLKSIILPKSLVKISDAAF